MTQVALENAGAPPSKFCPGRSDALDGEASNNSPPRTYYTTTELAATDNTKVIATAPNI